ncbi:12222_t:CDS:2 [Funneliformis caledonium]|uniref:12222_t:CDS:1 n=1 Tax=Funneliformis caledonium TaxID=1117310 RepID=A0A9N9C438_9GLOM|nr:12222_t:CDS:2 [Funneliformis caledonium]
MPCERANERSRGGRFTSSKDGRSVSIRGSVHSQDPSDISVVITHQSANQITDATVANTNQVRNQSAVDNQDKGFKSVNNNQDIRESSFIMNDIEESYSINKKSCVDDVNDFVDDHPDTHQNINNSIKDLNPNIPQSGKPLNNKPKFILCYKPSILFLRSRNLMQDAIDALVKSITPGFSNTSRMITFLKTKLNAYNVDYRSRLNSESRAYTEDYIKNNSVDVFRYFIAAAIRIHIINVFKCNNDPHFTNASALNKVKLLNYITCELQLPHNNSTNLANEIDANLLNDSSNKQRHGRKCRRENGREYNRNFRRK